MLCDVANASPSLVNTEPSFKHGVSVICAVAWASSSQAFPCIPHCRGVLVGFDCVLGALGAGGLSLLHNVHAQLGKAVPGREEGWEEGVSRQRLSESSLGARGISGYGLLGDLIVFSFLQ